MSIYKVISVDLGGKTLSFQVINMTTDKVHSSWNNFMDATNTANDLNRSKKKFNSKSIHFNKLRASHEK